MRTLWRRHFRREKISTEESLAGDAVGGIPRCIQRSGHATELGADVRQACGERTEASRRSPAGYLPTPWYWETQTSAFLLLPTQCSGVGDRWYCASNCRERAGTDQRLVWKASEHERKVHALPDKTQLEGRLLVYQHPHKDNELICLFTIVDLPAKEIFDLTVYVGAWNWTCDRGLGQWLGRDRRWQLPPIPGAIYRRQGRGATRQLPRPWRLGNGDDERLIAVG